METVRTFIAIELPTAVHNALASAMTTLRAADAVAALSVKWVDVHSIHLTLKFLGETPVDKLAAIGAALTSAASSSAPLPLSLARAGCFPNPRQPRVLWVGVAGDLNGLAHLQAAIERTVSPLGFPTEARPFSPHLTLGRVRDDATADSRQRLGAAVLALHTPPVEFTAASVCLMRSDLRPGGAVYTRLAVAALQVAASA